MKTKTKRKYKVIDSGTYIGNGKSESRKINCNTFYDILIIKPVKP